MEAAVIVVRGKTRLIIPVSQVRAAASSFRQVWVDVGTGDGRSVYRMAKANPECFCVGVDAHAAGMREVSFRASRKPTRGGTANAWFICAAIETLPTGLERLADHITIVYPWGRLLHVVLDPMCR